MKYFVLLMSFFLLSCSPVRQAPELNFPDYQSGSFSSVLHVSHSINYESGIDLIPDDIQVEYIFHEEISVRDFFLTFSIKGINIITNFSEEYITKGSGKDQERVRVHRKINLPFYKGSLVGLLYALEKSQGLFFEHRSGTLLVSDKKTMWIDVFHHTTREQIDALLASFGIDRRHYDDVLSRIVFEADYRQYEALNEYIQSNNSLAFLEYELYFLESHESDGLTSGFDWQGFSSYLDFEVLSELPRLAIEGTQTSFLSGSLLAPGYGMSFLLKHLREFVDFQVLQSISLQTMTNQDAEFKVIRTVPYVREYKITSLDEQSSRIAQQVDFGEVDQGLILRVRGELRSGQILTDIDLQLNEFLRFETVTTGPDLTVQRPVMNNREYKTLSRLVPGAIHKIGSFSYESYSYDQKKNFKIPFTKESSVKTHITILGRVAITRISFQPAKSAFSFNPKDQ